MSDQGMSDQAATAESRPLRRTRIGTVARARGNKMLRVEVDNLVKHWKYGKYIRRRTVLHVQDEKGEARQGDRVEIMECRPISKTKQWRLVRVLSRAASV